MTTHGIIDKDGRFKPVVHPAAGSLLGTAQGVANLHQRPTGIATKDADGSVKVVGVVKPNVDGGAGNLASAIAAGAAPGQRIQARSPFSRRK